MTLRFFFAGSAPLREMFPCENGSSRKDAKTQRHAQSNQGATRLTIDCHAFRLNLDHPNIQNFNQEARASFVQSCAHCAPTHSAKEFGRANR